MHTKYGGTEAESKGLQIDVIKSNFALFLLLSDKSYVPWDTASMHQCISATDLLRPSLIILITILKKLHEPLFHALATNFMSAGLVVKPQLLLLIYFRAGSPTGKDILLQLDNISSADICKLAKTTTRQKLHQRRIVPQLPAVHLYEIGVRAIGIYSNRMQCVYVCVCGD